MSPMKVRAGDVKAVHMARYYSAEEQEAIDNAVEVKAAEHGDGQGREKDVDASEAYPVDEGSHC